MNKNSKELLTEQPLQILIKLSLPAILGMIVIGLYPLMDGIFAGQILGEKAMTAVGIATPFTYINTGIPEQLEKEIKEPLTKLWGIFAFGFCYCQQSLQY